MQMNKNLNDTSVCFVMYEHTIWKKYESFGSKHATADYNVGFLVYQNDTTALLAHFVRDKRWVPLTNHD